MKKLDLFYTVSRACAYARVKAVYIIAFMAIFSLISKDLNAQSTVNNVVNLNGQKIEWRFHKYNMTRAQMQAILDKPANERYILIPIMVKLPTAFNGTRPILGAGMLDYEIRDPKTGLGSTEVVHHLASKSPTGAHFSALGKAGDILTADLSVVPGIETYYGGGMGWQKAPYQAQYEIPINKFDTVFHVPFYVNKVGSFDVCLKAQSNTACQAVDPSWKKCPGQYAFNTNFFDLTSREILTNSATNRSDFFYDNYGLFDPNSQFNSYNVCGGVNLLEFPNTSFDATDSACPNIDFIFDAFAAADINIDQFKIYFNTNGNNTFTNTLNTLFC